MAELQCVNAGLQQHDSFPQILDVLWHPMTNTETTPGGAVNPVTARLASKRGLVAVLVSALCGIVSCGTSKGFDWYIATHPVPQKLLNFLIGVFGTILPWFVGLYFSFVAVRSENRTLSTIGTVELMLYFAAGGWAVLVMLGYW